MIIEIGIDDLHIVRDLAHRIWPHTFCNILSEAQIAYMLERMYALPVLVENFTERGHRFLLISDENEIAGFASFQQDAQGLKICKLHKIYLLPSVQGKGLGRQLLDEVMRLAAGAGQSSLQLNVNRYNRAVDFYKYCGFEIVEEEDINIGNGYFMNDYVMEKRFGNPLL